MKHITNKRLTGRGGLRTLTPRLCSWVGSVGGPKACLPGSRGTAPHFHSLLTTPGRRWRQMLRAAKVFTKVTCSLASASLLLSLWLLLLSRALRRCRSSCRFFFSKRCCSRRCLFVTWKRRRWVSRLRKEVRGWQRQRAQLPSTRQNRENPPTRPNMMWFPLLLKFPFKCISPCWASKQNQSHSPHKLIQNDLKNISPGPTRDNPQTGHRTPSPAA